jgi:hypothetical protein
VAHARLLARGLVLAGLLGACTSEPAAKRPEPPPPVDIDVKKPPVYVTDASAWGRFHSKRFNLTVPLPDGKAWKIDDHHGPDMVAIHDATSSRFTVRATNEEGLMNRKRCEDRARALGIVPDDAEKTFTTVADEVWVGPEAYDSRVWVAIEAAKPGGGVTGHVFLFGSFIRRCLLVHLATTIPSPQQEEVLATRLAVGEEKIVKAIALDAPRTTEDATLPKEKPELRR